MSEAARRDLARKRHWAEPGSRHDRVVRATKFVLPILILALLVDPRHRAVRQARRRQLHLRQEQGRRRAGTDAGRGGALHRDRRQGAEILDPRRSRDPADQRPPGRRYQGHARAARPRARAAVDRRAARVATISTSKRSRSTGRCGSPDPTAIGSKRATSAIDLKNRNLASRGRVVGDMRLGHFEAGRMSADLGTREVVLSDGVRLNIRQGAIR